MALDGEIFSRGYIYSYNGKETYSNIYKEDEPPFYDPQTSLSFLDNQTYFNDSSFLQEEYYGDTTTFLDQSPHEIAMNEARSTPQRISSCRPNCHISYHRDMGNNQAMQHRPRVKKNKEEINYKRMTHIAMERNRRKLMNEHLSVLRSLMPETYVQRCDQASIVGCAINFIRGLEHRLNLLNSNGEPNDNSFSGDNISSATPFSDAFKLPQFSLGSSAFSKNVVHEVNTLADIEVSLVENYASLKIRSKRRPKLLLNVVSGLQGLGFIILHLNVSTVSDFLLYCFSTKMEECCKLTSVADIATAVYEIIRIYHDS